MNTFSHNAVLRWAAELDFVFTVRDLQTILRQKTNITVFRTIRSLVEQGALIKIVRGLYATPEATLPTIAQRLYPESYVSTGTALARDAIIGSVPARHIQSIKLGSPRSFATPLGTIEYFSIAPRLFMGFERRDGQLWASPEKAYLDVCYYYFRGTRFSFNPESDVDRSRLNGKVITRFLKKYDKRFESFFRETFWP